MKKLFFLASIVLFSSCINEESLNFKKNSVDLKNVKKVETELDKEKQLELYLKVNSEEKLQIWKNRISSFVEKGDFSERQKNVLNIINNKISNQFFESDQNSIEKVKQFELEILPLISGTFSETELKTIFASLKPIGKNYISNLRPNNPQPNCECNGNSIWDCDDCEGGCRQSSHGCGTFLLFSPVVHLEKNKKRLFILTKKSYI